VNISHSKFNDRKIYTLILHKTLQHDELYYAANKNFN